MPKTYTQTVYTFAELRTLGNSAPIEKARQWLQELAVMDEFWSEDTLEEWKTALSQIGFANAEIAYSGFWSQGDGASFTASVDLPKLIGFLAAPPAASECVSGNPEDFRPFVVHHGGGVRNNPKFARLLLLLDYLGGASVTRDSHHYSHENTCTFTVEDLRDEGEWISSDRKLYNEFVEAAEELRCDLSQAIYKALEAEYEYRTSDEAIAEDAEANDYTFTASGRRAG